MPITKDNNKITTDGTIVLQIFLPMQLPLQRLLMVLSQTADLACNSITQSKIDLSVQISAGYYIQTRFSSW